MSELDVLRFIVLGQIPGTHIQINLIHLVIVGLFCLLVLEVILNTRRRQMLALAEVAVKTPVKRKKYTKSTTKRKKTTTKARSRKTPKKKLDEIAL